MTDEQLDPIQEARFSRRSLLVTGGLTAAGLTAVGAAPTVAFGANRRATDTIRFAMITHGDTGSFWSVFKKGVDQATTDLKARGMSTTQVYANNNVAQQVAGINAAIANHAHVIATTTGMGTALRSLTKRRSRASRSSRSTPGSARSTRSPTTWSTWGRPRTSPARERASSSSRRARRRCSS